MIETGNVRPLVPFLPAIAAAVHDATGVWLTEQPFTPERVLTALTSDQPGGGPESCPFDDRRAVATASDQAGGAAPS